MKAVKGFQGAYILWSRVGVAFPQLKWTFRGYNYSNVKVAYQVYVRKLPVLVEVNGAKIGAPRHWVLYLGNQRMVDPWVGEIRKTDYYPPTGYSLIEKR